MEFTREILVQCLDLLNVWHFFSITQLPLSVDLLQMHIYEVLAAGES